MSRDSSMRVATESRIVRAEEAEMLARASRCPRSCASGASTRGARTAPAPRPPRARVNAPIQRTPARTCQTCQKQATTPITKTTAMNPLR